MADEVTVEQLRARLSRIEGQIRGIAKMLDSDRPCEEVVTQLMAARSGIDNVGALLLDSHVGRCMEGAVGARLDEQLDALRESVRLWWRFAPAAPASPEHTPSEHATHPRPGMQL